MIRIIIGSILFLIGMSIHGNVISMLIALLGCYILSRPIALESAFGNTPAFFLIGILFFIPTFFLLGYTLRDFEVSILTSEVIRITMCLFFGTITFLSICKK